MNVAIYIKPASGGYSWEVYYACQLAEQGFRLIRSDAVDAACNAAKRVLS